MPRAVRVDRPGLQGGVGQRQLGHGHAHLTLAAHHLQPLADRLLLLFLQRAEVVDLAGELPGLGAEAGGQGLGRAERERRRRRCGPAKAPSHRASLVLPSGQTTPTPVMTTRRAADVIQLPCTISATNRPFYRGSSAGVESGL